MANVPTEPKKIDAAHNAHIERIVLGADGESGEEFYLDADETWKPAINNVSADEAKGKCILLGSQHSGTQFKAGETVDGCFGGRVWGFSGLTAGKDVYTGGTVGKMDQTAPVAGGTFTSKVGYAWDANSIMIAPQGADPIAN